MKHSIFKNIITDDIATIINDRAAGMCNKTLGTTFVIYKYKNDTHEYPFIMEHREFHKKHSKLYSNN